MLRLRTTSTLSLLALAIGIAGTGWLCTLTSDWRPVPTQLVQPMNSPGTVSTPRHRKHADSSGRIASGRVKATAVQARPLEVATIAPVVAAPALELIPLSMPPDNSQPWQSLRGHLDGRVLVHLQIDGRGRVNSARVADSSGDPVLDEHALRSVRGWRFAVAADHPEGIEGNLPMRFASADRQLAAAP